MEEQKLKLKLNEVEAKMIAELEAATGWDAVELLRLGLRLMYKKEFPSYLKPLSKKKKADKPDTGIVEDPEKTPEQRCIEEGGEVGTDDEGRKVCRIKKGAMTVTKIL